MPLQRTNYQAVTGVVFTLSQPLVFAHFRSFVQGSF